MTRAERLRYQSKQARRARRLRRIDARMNGVLRRDYGLPVFIDEGFRFRV